MENPLAKAVHILLVEIPSLWLLSCYSYSHDSITTQARRSTWYDTRPDVCCANLVRHPKATTKQVTGIANSLKDLAATQSKPSVTQGLHLPPVVHLLTFKGNPQDNLSRFLEHFNKIISMSAVSHAFRLPISNNNASQMSEHLTSYVKHSKITLKLIFPIHRKLLMQNI